MFERFTDRARRVLVLAQEEARLLNHNFIGTEHLLLGLIHEGDSVAAKALRSLGVNLEAVREKVEETIGPAGAATTGSPPFTPRAKKVLELSLREALQLGHNYIGTEHILLGVVREGEGVGAQVLIGLGADLGRVRQAVIDLLSGYMSGTGDPSAITYIEHGDGPRCPACRALLDGHVVYRVLSVPPADQEPPMGGIDVVFVYCLRCGVVIAHTPGGDTGIRLLAHTPTVDTGTWVSRGVAAVVPGPIDLTLRGQLLDGTVNGALTHLDLGERSHDMTVHGMFAAAALDIRVSYDSNYESPIGLTARLTGTFAGQQAELSFGYDLETSYRFQRGEVIGNVAGRRLRVTVTPTSPFTDGVSISGRWGSANIALSASVGGDLTNGTIGGTIGDTAVDISARSSWSAGSERTVQVTGTWDGPVALLALGVGVLVNFM